MIEELIYKAWENPQATDIEEDVVMVVESIEELEKEGVDKIVNRIYNVSDVYQPDSVDWVERVVDVVKPFVDGE